MKIIINWTRIGIFIPLNMALLIFLWGHSPMSALIVTVISVPFFVLGHSAFMHFTRNRDEDEDEENGMGGVLPDDVDQRMAIFTALREREIPYRIVRYNELEAFADHCDAELHQIFEDNGLVPLSEKE